MKLWRYILSFLMLILVCSRLLADDETIVWTHDPQLQTANPNQPTEDSIFVTETKGNIEVLPENEWRPDPAHAVWMGAIIPSYGQIYNRSYWKLPIVYGAFMGCIYAITWNNATYQDYRIAYRDIVLDTNYSPDDPSKSYVAILPEGYTVERMGGRETYTNTLKNYQNTYRRYRDLSIVATVLVYALTLIDAYVDAQLYDFDISPDLSMTTQPQVGHDPLGNHISEVKLAIRF